jgi:hypothetical protein
LHFDARDRSSQSAACDWAHLVDLRKDVVLNGMIIAIETWITIDLSEISITSSLCAPT